MPLDAKAIGKPFRKLRKFLKDFPNPPGPEEVHEVRTHTRRIEAIVGALRLDGRSGKRLVHDLKPIRKAAGEVRDMDVLTDLAASIDPRDDGDCRLKLMQYLARRRTKAAKKLVKKVNSGEKELRAELKACRAAVESDLDDAESRDARAKGNPKRRAKAAQSVASLLEIEQEMRDFPRLNQDNIHPFRLKVKELRYTLQLGQESDSKLTDALGAVKDQIGLWHDWNELAAIAEQVLEDGGCAVLAEIRGRAKQEFQKALGAANSLRAQFLFFNRGIRSKKPAVREVHPAVVEATSRLAS